MREGGAWVLFKKAWNKENYEEAADWLKKLIKSGDGSACLKFLLGNCEGKLGHPSEEFKWHKQAAEQGDASAQCFIGIDYISGDGVEKDVDAGVFWLKKAAEQGDETAVDVLRKLNVR